MKLRTIAVVLALVSACDKTSDLGARVEEANTEIHKFAPELDVLARRTDELIQRTRQLPAGAPGIVDASRALLQARAEITRLRGVVGTAPQAIAADAKAGAEQLGKTFDDLKLKLDNGTTIIGNELEAADNVMTDIYNGAKQAPTATTTGSADSVPPGLADAIYAR